MASPIRTINAPGVEIRERDISDRAPQPVGTSVMVMGYTNRGEAYEPVSIVSVSDLEANFGKPSNEAERYFDHACKDIINENGTLLAAKLPYDNTMDTYYKYIPVDIANNGSVKSYEQLSGEMLEISGALTNPDSPLDGSTTISGYYEVSLGTLSGALTSDYDIIAAGGKASDTGTLSGVTSEFIITNERKNTRSGPNEDEGIFVTICDPIHGLLVQRSIIGSDDPDNDIMSLINATTARVAQGELSASTFNENLSSTYSGSSVSETMMKYFPTVDFVEDGAQVSNEYANWISVIISRTVSNPNAEGNLDVVVLEAWNGSIKTTAKDTATGRSVYIGDVINNNSSYITWYATDPTAQPIAYMSEKDAFYTKSQDIKLASFTTGEADPKIKGRNVVNNIKTILEKVSNIDEVQIDVVLDGGLSTIAQYCTHSEGEHFTPAVNNFSSTWSTINSSYDVTYWRAVVQELDNFCKNVRKDCMVVADVPRNLVIDGELKYIRKTAPNNTFSNTIGKRLKYVTGINSSYVALYGNWVRALDTNSGNNTWLPQSIKAAGIYVRNDTVGNIWDAPAGLNRGIINGINDIAYNPGMKEAEQLYLKSINYARLYPLDGFALEGQKTSQVKPSAFDRVNVRRLFLRLERSTYKLSRVFVYEPNNEFTRSRYLAALEPVFQNVKAQGGLYDYRIVCDETNNTATVIDNNEMRIAIGLKPVRTIEFILADFIATSTETSFDEVL